MPPSLPASVIARGRLWERLDWAVDPEDRSDIVVLSAPAGYGKTTMLASWAAGVVARGRPVAWCALDDTDAACYRFWSALLAALSSSSGALDDALQGVGAPHRTGDAEFIDGLAEAIDGSGVVLVVDNVQELTDAAVLRDLNSLLGRLPADTSLVLSSRFDPPLPALQRARVSGRLVQLRAGELAFSLDEVARCCPALTADQVAAVWRRTEGWPAMVRLMELALSGVPAVTPDEEGSWAADEVVLADSVFQEMFSHQGEVVQNLLLASGVPTLVPIDLAVHLSGMADAGARLEELAQRMGLVSRVEGHEGIGDEPAYRFHPLLRAYLHGELLRREPHLERKLQRRAAEWCLDHGQDLAAVHHAVAASDHRYLDTVLRAVGPGLINSGDAGALLFALQGWPRTGNQGPWTTLIRAAALLDQGSPVHTTPDEFWAEPTSRTRRPSRLVDSGAPAELRVARQAIEVRLARHRGLAPPLVDGAATQWGGGDLDLRILLATQRGAALAWQGNLEDAQTELGVGVGLARGSGRTAALIDCLSMLAAVHCARSDFTAMRHCAGEALDLAESQGWDNAGRTAYPHALQGWGAHQALEPGLARAHAARAAELVGPHADIDVRVMGEVLAAALAFDDPEARTHAADHLHASVAEYAGWPLSPAVRAYAAVTDARMSVLTRRAHRITATSQLLASGLRAERALLAAMQAESTGHRDQARAVLATLTRDDAAVTVPLTHVEALAFAAGLACQDGEEFAATQLARRALQVADDLQGLRPLVDAGEHLHDLLRRGRGRWAQHEGVAIRVLDHAAAPSLPAAALTAREMEMLRELPSLNTVEDIAAEFHVSVNTVKTHLRSIYRKLGVGTRRAAVAQARRTGLI